MYAKFEHLNCDDTFSTVVNKGMFITSLHYFSAGDELLSSDSYLIVDVFPFSSCLG